MMQPRKAFTLMELLVVIGIIGILAGMVFAGVQVAKKAGLKTKTTNILSQVSQALNSYKLQCGSYPDTWITSPPTNEYDSVFITGALPGTIRMATDTGINWSMANTLMINQLNDSGQSFPNPMKDAWNSDLRYRPAKYYPFDPTSPADPNTPLIDRDTGVPCRDSFQLWSLGPDRQNQYGQPTYPLAPAPGSKKGDDLTSWSQ